MTPLSPNTLVEVLRATLEQLEQHEQCNSEAMRELRRSIILTIAELDMRERGDVTERAA